MRSAATVRAWKSIAVLACCAAATGAAGCGGGGSSGTNHAAASLGTELFGTLPPVGTPKPGGVLTLGQLTGQTPTYIFPIIPGAQTQTGTISFVSQLYMPLYAGPNGAVPEIDYGQSAATAPTFTNNDKTVTIHLKPGLKWSNGDPIDANDVVFWLDILKAGIKESAANWGQYTPGLIPDNVKSATAQGDNVVLQLDKSYNPGFFLNNNLQDTNNVYPLPSRAWNVAKAGGPHLDYTNPANAKKIYDYLNKAGGSVASFASSPLWKVNSGPFQLKSFSPTNSSYTLVPNPNYGGTPKALTDQVSVQTYTSFTAELNAVKSGSLDVMVGFDPSQLGEVSTLKSQGIDVFGSPQWGWFGGQINFKDTTDHFDKVIAQVYVRAAISHLIDQAGIVKGVYKNAAVAAYGPTPSAPYSPYAGKSATVAPYPFNPAAAVSVLKSHGWKVVPNGTTTCIKPGTAADECGAGIPAGTPIRFIWANQPESVSSVGALESEALASQAKQSAGIDIELQTKTFNFLTENYNDANPAAAKYTNDWGVNNFGGLNTDYYPTASGVWNEGAGFNQGAYSNPEADKLINASLFSGNPAAVKTEGDFFAANPPVFFLPAQDYLLAVNAKKVGGTAKGWLSMTQQQFNPQFWYLTK